jgi:hypothetical protein
MPVTIHPLVFLSLSDHFTRARLTGALDTQKRLVGCLLGIRMGTNVELFSAFEVNLSGDKINTEFLHQRAEQVIKCYKEYSILGWYIIGPSPRPTISLHQQFTTATKCQLYALAYDPLQVSIETQFILFEQQETNFVPVPFEPTSSEGERIAIAAVEKGVPGSDQSSDAYVSNHLQFLQSVIKILRERVVAVREYLVRERDSLRTPAQGFVCPFFSSLHSPLFPFLFRQNT